MIAEHDRTHAARRRALFTVAIAASVVFLVLHLPFLPKSLEDLDSINFALGLHRFDVAAHRPHPPGYPVFIAAGRIARALTPSDATALAALSILAGSLGVLALAAFYRRVVRDDRLALAGTALAVASPLYWFTAGRPLSDMTGLAAGVAVQAMTLSAANARALAVASFCAGLGAGIRSQVVWLTLPLLALAIVRGRGEHGGSVARIGAAAASSYIVGVLIWAVPLVLLTGGPAAYWRAVFNQGAEDLSGIRMLWTTPTARELVDALYYAFAAPWATWMLAVPVLVFALIGVVALMRRHSGALLTLAIAFGPYLAFDIVFQETFTSRYALPLVVPIALLSAAGVMLLPRAAAGIAVVLLVAGSAHVGGSTLGAYSRQKAPAFRLLDDIHAAAADAMEPPVLAMDRREALDLRRPIEWVGGEMPHIAAQLPSPPQREWLELVKYWDGGGQAPVWFVADPLRTDVDLVQHPEPTRYRWSLPFPVLIEGVRPNEMDWYRLERGDWYVGEGWALTPEAAGVATVDRRGLAYAPIEGRVSRRVFGGFLVVGGRNLDATVHPRVTVAVGHAWARTFDVAPGPFLHVDRLPSVDFDAATSDNFPLTITAEPPARVAIEQFDASGTRPIFGFGEGWHEPEYDPATGRQWRWVSDSGELRVANAAVRQPLRLHIEGESPLKYFSRGSHVTLRAGAATLFDQTLTKDFSMDVTVPSVQDREQTITITTDQVYTPADRSRPWRRSGDRRRLGLRIFTCELTAAPSPASARGTGANSRTVR